MRLEFAIEHSILTPTSDYVEVGDADPVSPIETLTEAVIFAIHTDIEVTVNGVTMHLAAWRDPDHWATDWATKLDVPVDEAPAAAYALLGMTT